MTGSTAPWNERRQFRDDEAHRSQQQPGRVALELQRRHRGDQLFVNAESHLVHLGRHPGLEPNERGRSNVLRRSRFVAIVFFDDNGRRRQLRQILELVEMRHRRPAPGQTDTRAQLRRINWSATEGRRRHADGRVARPLRRKRRRPWPQIRSPGCRLRLVTALLVRGAIRACGPPVAATQAAERSIPAHIHGLVLRNAPEAMPANEQFGIRSHLHREIGERLDEKRWGREADMAGEALALGEVGIHRRRRRELNVEDGRHRSGTGASLVTR
mmetsp:Transcript_107148/g.308300  ORF Transcript_107148/g.308300 Transcript_107148/m.308300 type:complete len:271 (+) Transcript_107148:501-1313(+)